MFFISNDGLTITSFTIITINLSIYITHIS